MALYLDHYVFQPGVKSRHRVRHRVIDGRLADMTVPEAIKEARLDYRFNPPGQRSYVLRVLTDPDAP